MIIIPVAQLEHGAYEISDTVSPGELRLENDDLSCFEAPISYQLKAELVSGGVLLTGMITTTVHCCCARCTTKFDLVLTDGEICHFYEECSVAQLDVSDDIREDMQIMLPMNPLCVDDCRGLCQQCGINLNQASCDCHLPPVEDDIWGDLDNLIFDD